MDLAFCDNAELRNEGRNFNCKECPKSVQKLRRCRENRWDFTADDGAIFPMYINKGGNLYGFCPSKVARDDQKTVRLFNLLILCHEYKVLPFGGDLVEQPEWVVDLLSDFAIKYDQMKFYSRMRDLFKSDSKKVAPNGNKSRRSNHRNISSR